MRHRGALDELAMAVGIFPTLQEGMEGTARAVVRDVAPERVAGPLAAIEDSQPAQEQYMTTNKPFSCPACGAEFSTRQDLQEHGKKMHPQGGQKTPPSIESPSRSQRSGTPSGDRRDEE